MVASANEPDQAQWRVDPSPPARPLVDRNRDYVLARDLQPGDLVRVEDMALIVERVAPGEQLVTLQFSGLDWELSIESDEPIRRLARGDNAGGPSSA
jgi:hypothetical protein